jgi:hypothetical protein
MDFIHYSHLLNQRPPTLHKSVATPSDIFFSYTLIICFPSTWYTETVRHVHTSTHNRHNSLLCLRFIPVRRLPPHEGSLIWYWLQCGSLDEYLIARGLARGAESGYLLPLVTGGIRDLIPEAHVASYTRHFHRDAGDVRSTLKHMPLVKMTPWSSFGDVQIPPTRWES